MIGCLRCGRFWTLRPPIGDTAIGDTAIGATAGGVWLLDAPPCGAGGGGACDGDGGAIDPGRPGAGAGMWEGI